MGQRRLLILTYHFPPSAASGAFRMLGFARHLPALGWNVSVVAPPSLPWEPTDPELVEKLPVETEIEHVPYPASKLARRFAQMPCWLPGAWSACKKVIARSKPDAVLTSGPPHVVHFVGLLLKRKFGIPWISDFRDPWYITGNFDRGRGLQTRRIILQERMILNAADLVIANAPGAEQVYRDDYPRLASKFTSISNGYDRDVFEAIPVKERPAKAPLNVVHTGAIYAGRDPRPFFDALRFLSDSRPVPGPEASFYGPPPELEFDVNAELEKRALLERVRIHGHVPYSRCLEEMKAADVLLLMDTPGRMVGVPAKLYEYIGARRPILALGESRGDLEWVLQKSGLPYRIVSPYDSAKIAAALAELGRERFSIQDDDQTDEPFSRESLTRQLAKSLDGLVDRPRETVVRVRDKRAFEHKAETLLGGR